MGKKAVVIGATGVVGRALVNQLVSTPEFTEIVTLTRRKIDYSDDKVVNHVIDFEHLDNCANLITGDCFFSCLGTTKNLAGSIENQRKVDYFYQLSAARIAAENHMSHLLLVSSSGANQHSYSAYLKMKGELETQIKMLPFKTISIFQPSLLLGDRQDFRLGEKIAALILPTLCKLPLLRRYRPITGHQVAVKMLTTCAQYNSGINTYTLDELF